MARDFSDDTFGTITQWQDGSWSVKCFVPAFGSELDIQIESEDFGKSERPNDRQYTAFKWLKDNHNNLKSIVEPHILCHYAEHIDATRSAWGDEADTNAPLLEKAEQIWELLSSPSVCLLSDYADVSIGLSARWDPEHGVTVFIKEGNVINVE